MAWSKFVRLVVGMFGTAIIFGGGWIHVTEPARTTDVAFAIVFGIVLVFAAVFLPAKWLEGFGP